MDTETQPIKNNVSPAERGTALMFDNNFGKCEPIFKILSPGDSRDNSLCTHRKDFHLTCNMLLRYLVKVENQKNVAKYSR